jgi:cold shock CspA family protein
MKRHLATVATLLLSCAANAQTDHGKNPIIEGVVKSYDCAKGTGVVTPEYGEEVPFNLPCAAKDKALKEGDHVTFRVMQSPQGLQATHVVKEK